MRKVNVLGTEYSIEVKTESEDEILKNNDGYCDNTTKQIVVLKMDSDNCTIHNPKVYFNKVLRHEIIHAFLFESGLNECTNPKVGNLHDEQMVDWIAFQFPKIYDAFKEADCL